MKEVEVLVEVLESKKGALEKLKLKRLNSHGIKNIHDIYFYNPRDGEIDLKKENVLDNTFRLRKKGDKYYLTFKTKRFDDNGKWLYSDEYETEVSDGEIMKDIIFNLGFKPLVEIKNERHVFTEGNYEVVLEDVQGLGLFLEVEVMDVKDEEDIAEINKQVFSYIKSLGINIGEELNYSKPDLMLKKKHGVTRI